MHVWGCAGAWTHWCDLFLLCRYDWLPQIIHDVMHIHMLLCACNYSILVQVALMAFANDTIIHQIVCCELVCVLCYVLFPVCAASKINVLLHSI